MNSTRDSIRQPSSGQSKTVRDVTVSAGTVLRSPALDSTGPDRSLETNSLGNGLGANVAVARRQISATTPASSNSSQYSLTDVSHMEDSLTNSQKNIEQFAVDLGPGLSGHGARPKIVIIGPSADRYRGGIAQFTSRLAAELNQFCELRFISWNKLYPTSIMERQLPVPTESWTARNNPPGATQGQGTFTNRIGKVSPAPTLPGEDILSISDIASWRQAVDTITSFQPQAIFFTWSHPVHAPVYAYLIKKLARTTKAELCGICHNVLPHEDFPGAKTLTRMGLKGLHRIVVHGHSEEDQAHALFPQMAITSLFVPLFDFLGPAASLGPIGARQPVREIRRPKNILYFGTIRNYKGVDVLLRAMPRVVAQIPNARLKIVGEKFFSHSSVLRRIFGETEDPLRLIDELGLSRVVSVQNRYVPDSEISAIFSDVDMAVFPFRTPSLSASLMLAYAHGIPVVASRNGGFVDSVVPGVTGYFAEPNDPTSLAASIVHLLRNPISSEQVHEATRNLTWKNYAAALLGRHCSSSVFSDVEHTLLAGRG